MHRVPLLGLPALAFPVLIAAVLAACAVEEPPPPEAEVEEDPAWSSLAPVPEPRTEVSVTQIEDRIYLLGGFTEPDDPEADERAPAATDMWVYHTAASLNGWLYIFGGETFDPGAARTFDEAERYSLAQDRWEVLEPMPTTRHGLGAAVVDGAIYVISGGPGPGFTFGTANERFVPEDS